MYKKFRTDWDSRTKLPPVPIGPSNIVAFDALNLKHTKGDDGSSLKGRKRNLYLVREVIWHIIKYYNTFNGAFESGIRIHIKKCRSRCIWTFTRCFIFNANVSDRLS